MGVQESAKTMANNNNPAGRLYNIFSIVLPNSPGTTCRVVWAGVSGVKPGNTEQILQVLAKLIGLVGEAKEAVKQLQGVQLDLYLAPFNNIERAFSNLNLEMPWANFSSNLDATTMLSLQFAADTLALQRPEPTIAQDKLNEIQAEVEALITKVVSSSLPTVLKSMIIDNLEKIRRAIIDYGLTGVAGISEVVDVSFGSTLRLHDEVKEAIDAAPENKEIFAGFFKIVGNLSTLTTFASTSYKLVAPIFGLPALPAP